MPLKHLLILSPLKSYFVVFVCPHLTVLPFYCSIFLRFSGLVSHLLWLSMETTIKFSKLFLLVLQLNQGQAFAWIFQDNFPFPPVYVNFKKSPSAPILAISPNIQFLSLPTCMWLMLASFSIWVAVANASESSWSCPFSYV